MSATRGIRNRDDFPQAVKRELERRAGHRCSICGAATSGPQGDPARGLSIGVAAHITGASPGGARYDHTLTHEERISADNGIWACHNCGDLIDYDRSQFTVNELRQRKQAAEQSARILLGKPLATGLDFVEQQHLVDLGTKRSALRDVIATTLDEVHALLTRAVDKSQSEALQTKAARLHAKLDQTAALFLGEFQDIHDALVDLGQWVGVWWNPAWLITNDDFTRYFASATRIKEGLTAIDDLLQPRQRNIPLIDALVAALADWVETLTEFRDISSDEYDDLRPQSVLSEFERTFDRALRRAEAYLDEPATDRLKELRAHLLAVSLQAKVRPRSDLYPPGGLVDQARERNWSLMTSAYDQAIRELRRLLK